jgi:hypothetical protein
LAALFLRRSEMAKVQKSNKIHWLTEVEEHDYPAAESYLRILYTDDKITEIISMLRDTTIITFKAKDIFRASQLSLLGVSNSHVEKDRKKIRKGASLSPLLLVRDEINAKVIIADGYHRLCAIYGFNEDELIHCKIV